MSDRIKALTVVLESDIRDDDAQPLIDAIRMLRGVVCVKADVADIDHYCAVEKARHQLQQELRDILWKR